MMDYPHYEKTLNPAIMLTIPSTKVPFDAWTKSRMAPSYKNPKLGTFFNITSNSSLDITGSIGMSNDSKSSNIKHISSSLFLSKVSKATTSKHKLPRNEKFHNRSTIQTKRNLINISNTSMRGASINNKERITYKEPNGIPNATNLPSFSVYENYKKMYVSIMRALFD